MSKVDATTINQALLAYVAVTAKAAVNVSKIHDNQKSRWMKAIDAAMAELQQNPYFQFEEDALIILSETSNQLYEVKADGSHVNCTAFRMGHPCRHRAARRLLQLYAEAASLPHFPVPAETPTAHNLPANLDPQTVTQSRSLALPAHQTDCVTPALHTCKICDELLKDEALEIHTYCALFGANGGTKKPARAAKQGPRAIPPGTLVVPTNFGERYNGVQI